MKNTELLEAKSFNELLDLKYGKIGTPNREEHEIKANNFVVAELIKEARKEANMTQK
jgi:hypothetical protein